VTVAWFHPFSGVAGDMALGALVDAGADIDAVRAYLERLPIGGWAIEAHRVMRGTLSCTQVQVRIDHDLSSRSCRDILQLVEDAHYPEQLSKRVRSIFLALANVEGRLHGVAPEDVHFHEVGGVDAIVDVVGTCAALELLDVDEVSAGPVALGVGVIHAAHGRFPNPPPAVVRLLEGVPVTGVDIGVELTTPTGAALLSALCTHWGSVPSMVVQASGFGAGSRDLIGMPNVTQVVLGVRRPNSLDPSGEETPSGLVAQGHHPSHQHAASTAN